MNIYFSAGAAFALSLLLCHSSTTAAENARPNVLWFVVDDMSAHLSCYGEKLIATPHLDRLAAEGTRFTRAYVTAPVCSASRSALITGSYQTTIGAHHHRSGRGEMKIHLPDDVETLPAILQRAGYHTCIGSGLPGLDHRGLEFPAKAPPKRLFGKTDYNFEWDPAIYDSHDWAERAEGQPFFMQVQLHGGKLREGPIAERDSFRNRVLTTLGSLTPATDVELPPYYPRDPVLLQDWADYLDSVRLTDHLKCLGLWQQGVRVDPQRQTGTDPPHGDWVYELVEQDPFPDYDSEPVLFYANA